MLNNQQGDVTLKQTNDGGEIEVVNGVVSMSGGLETSVYLAMFGGNESDNGRATNPLTWWGNSNEKPENQYRSKTQNLLQSLPATTANLLEIELAVKSDLSYLTDLKIASSVEVFVSMPAINHVNINIIIQAQGVESEFNFSENWKTIQNDLL